MTIIDHLIVFLLLVILPLYQHFYFAPKMRREFANESPGLRERYIWETIAIQWAMVAGLGVFWWLGSRGGADLGLITPRGWGFWVSLPVVIIALAVVYVMQRAHFRTPSGYASTIEELKKAAPFAPHSAHDFKHWTALSITAGLCEEVLYRGFLIWYASHFTGTGTGGLLLAVVLTSLAFGLGHMYQGVGGAARVFGVGLAFGGIYVWSGSLWVPIAAHALLDIVSGYAIMRLYIDPPPPGLSAQPQLSTKSASNRTPNPVGPATS